MPFQAEQSSHCKFCNDLPGLFPQPSPFYRQFRRKTVTSDDFVRSFCGIFFSTLCGPHHSPSNDPTNHERENENGKSRRTEANNHGPNR